MRKKQFGRKIAAIAMATAMAISAAFSGGVNGGTRVHAAPEGATVPVRQDSASSINYSSILGRAVDYGIVAENFKQMNHMESTFAVKNYASLKGDANDIDKLDPKATAHVLVGALDKANSGGTAPIKDEAPDDFVPAEYSLNNSNDQFNVRSIINVGSCSAKTMIFEGPNAVLTDNYICVDNVKDKPKDELDFRWKYNEATDASIDLIINKAFDYDECDCVRQSPLLDEAIACIQTYYDNEFGDDHGDVDEDNLSEISLAYTTTEDEEYQIYAYADLIQNRVYTQLGYSYKDDEGNHISKYAIVREDKYDTLKDMIDNDLSCLDSFEYGFSELVSISDEEMEKYYEKYPDERPDTLDLTQSSGRK